jgi:hypothetical protein
MLQLPLLPPGVSSFHPLAGPPVLLGPCPPLSYGPRGPPHTPRHHPHLPQVNLRRSPLPPGCARAQERHPSVQHLSVPSPGLALKHLAITLGPLLKTRKPSPELSPTPPCFHVRCPALFLRPCLLRCFVLSLLPVPRLPPFPTPGHHRKSMPRPRQCLRLPLPLLPVLDRFPPPTERTLLPSRVGPGNCRLFVPGLQAPPPPATERAPHRRGLRKAVQAHKPAMPRQGSAGV